MSSIFDKLSFGSTSSAVTAFKNLVEDQIDSTTKSVTSTLSSTVDNITSTGKNIINSATNTINNTTNNIINSATSTINNITNTGKNIVNSATNTVNSIKDDLNNEYKKFKQTAESVVTEFDFDLYTKALKLPECQNVSFNYVEGLAGNLIGTFTGSKTYKDFNGTIESSINGAVSQLSGSISSQFNNVTSQITGASSQITGAVTQLGNKFSGQLSGTISQVGGQIGKAILDPSSPGYAIFTNNDITEIISIDDFNPESLIDDFSDLYQTLLNNKFSKLENYTSDIKSLGSLFTSFSEFTSDDIIGTISDQFNTFTGDLVDNVSGLWDSASTDIFSTIDSFKNIVIPDTINSTQTNLSIPDSANKLISTIPSSDNSTAHGSVSDIAKGISNLSGKEVSISTSNINPSKLDLDSNGLTDQNIDKHTTSNFYDTLNVAQVQATITYDGLKNPLLCWQQPESISYSASAQFDGVPSRGTQQPFQFYNCANQITLGFELKWHIDELELYKSQYKTLQEIADIAEDFTRPYSYGDSLMPKLCTVTLPSLSEIGYITEAQISYGGALTGNDPYNYAVHKEMKDNENLMQRVSDNDLKKIDDNLHRVNNTNTDYTNTDYQYSTLTINFQLLLVKDIKLSPTAKDVEAAADAETARNASLNAAKTGDMSYVKNLDFDKNQSVLPEEPKSTEQIASTAQTAYEATISSQPIYANAQAQASLFYSSEAFAGSSSSSNMSSQ